MTGQDHLEVEVKLYVEALDAVAATLQQEGAELVKPRVYEHNIRYEDPNNTFTRRGVVLRLRQDGRVRLTYKEPATQIDPNIPARFEAEVEVSDFDTMNLILGRLDYHKHMIYEKYRTTYTLNGCEIVLDEMPYGNFVEIEGKPESIRGVIEQLNLTEAAQYNTNYIRLFDNICYLLDLEFTDLTFENFNSVDVQQWMFEPGAVTKHALQHNTYAAFEQLMREWAFRVKSQHTYIVSQLEFLAIVTAYEDAPHDASKIRRLAEKGIEHLQRLQNDFEPIFFPHSMTRDNDLPDPRGQLWAPYDYATWQKIFMEISAITAPYFEPIASTITQLSHFADLGRTTEKAGNAWRVGEHIPTKELEVLRKLLTLEGVDAVVIEGWQYTRNAAAPTTNIKEQTNE